MRVPRPYRMTAWAPKWRMGAKLGFPCRVGYTTRITTCMITKGLVSQFGGVELMERERQQDNASMIRGCPRSICQVLNSYLQVDVTSSKLLIQKIL